MTIQCCVCRKIRNDDGTWRDQRAADDMEYVSHTYCQACYEQAMREFDAEIRGKAS